MAIAAPPQGSGSRYGMGTTAQYAAQSLNGTGTKVAMKMTTQSQPIQRRRRGTGRAGATTDGWAQRPPPTSSTTTTHTYQLGADGASATRPTSVRNPIADW